MAEITVEHAFVEIPVQGVGGDSLKTLLLRRAVGGRLAKTGSGVLVSALSDISFEARDGDRIGLVGHNGAGKTSLLRMLAGVYPPTRGRVRVTGRISPMLNVSLGMSHEATGIENVRICGALWGLSREEIDASLDEVVQFTELGDYLNMPVRTYSSGMLMRLAFAIATMRQPEVLLIDEVIGTGDAAFVEKARARLERIAIDARILVLSSHSPAILEQLCNRAIWLKEGAIAAHGSLDEILPAYAEAMKQARTARPAAQAVARLAAS